MHGRDRHHDSTVSPRTWNRNERISLRPRERSRPALAPQRLLSQKHRGKSSSTTTAQRFLPWPKTAFSPQTNNKASYRVRRIPLEFETFFRFPIVRSFRVAARYQLRVNKRLRRNAHCRVIFIGHVRGKRRGGKREPVSDTPVVKTYRFRISRFVTLVWSGIQQTLVRRRSMTPRSCSLRGFYGFPTVSYHRIYKNTRRSCTMTSVFIDSSSRVGYTVLNGRRTSLNMVGGGRPVARAHNRLVRQSRRALMISSALVATISSASITLIFM